MIYSTLVGVLEAQRVHHAPLIASAISVALILLLAAGLLQVLRRIAIPLLARLAAKTPTRWDEIAIEQGCLRYLSWLAIGLFVQVLARGMPEEHGLTRLIQQATDLWMLSVFFLFVCALLDTIHVIYNRYPFSRQFPIRVYVQIFKLVLFLVTLIVAVSSLIGRSPAFLFTGLGAMTAVLMLVFKDPILGFVAGIQLSANRMLAIGDWLEMPKYNADGDVIDITLTTVKVVNWDRTITTIPTYALISDAFKNWRGMTESGGRRIKRSLYLDMTSVRFLSADEIERMRKIRLLREYMEEKLADIARDRRARGDTPCSSADERALTNIGTFRAYLVAYLRHHAGIRQDMIMIVRQLQPTPQGLPLEIYAFVNDTQWVPFEGIQSDIFDHVLAVLHEFGLRVFQAPSGGDVLALAGRLQATGGGDGAGGRS